MIILLHFIELLNHYIFMQPGNSHTHTTHLYDHLLHTNLHD